MGKSRKVQFYPNEPNERETEVRWVYGQGLSVNDMFSIFIHL